MAGEIFQFKIACVICCSCFSIFYRSLELDVFVFIVEAHSTPALALVSRKM